MLTFPEPKFRCPICGKNLDAQISDGFLDDTEVLRSYECRECGWEGVVRYAVKGELQEHWRPKQVASEGRRKKQTAKRLYKKRRM